MPHGPPKRKVGRAGRGKPLPDAPSTRKAPRSRMAGRMALLAHPRGEMAVFSQITLQVGAVTGRAGNLWRRENQSYF